uniref:Uncharacterized protein ycf18 n=1 Tax=Bornetia secundiflora TaxID=2575637 RepID=A0A4D6WMI1_9FLOR|nr:gbilisome degradation protein [Bornetia secundiflora]
MTQLNLEQEFKLAIYKKKIYQINQIYIKTYLILSLKQMLIKDNFIKNYLIKHMSL